MVMCFFLYGFSSTEPEVRNQILDQGSHFRVCVTFNSSYYSMKTNLLLSIIQWISSCTGFSSTDPEIRNEIKNIDPQHRPQCKQMVYGFSNTDPKVRNQMQNSDPEYKFQYLLCSGSGL